MGTNCIVMLEKTDIIVYMFGADFRSCADLKIMRWRVRSQSEEGNKVTKYNYITVNMYLTVFV